MLLAACGGPLKYSIPSSPKAPGADAELVADVRDDQNQTQLEMEVTNLAPPDRIANDATSYVAWFRKSPETVWSRIGSVAYDADKRKGEFTGTVPELAFDFEVTAETVDSAASPSGNVIFNQRVAKK